MSRDIVILTPNGRRVKVHCTADTNILQLLEDVCAKQGLEPNDYDLKHHKHILDLTTTVRFCNLPNKAFLEMVEAEKKRVESNVTIGLTLNDGERLTGDFSPNTSLYDLITSLAPNELQQLKNPTISYMRQEVTGVSALKEKSLRQLGLIAGRAVLRLLDKTEATFSKSLSVAHFSHSAVRRKVLKKTVASVDGDLHEIKRQANVSSVYRRIKTETPESDLKVSAEQTLADKNEQLNSDDLCKPGPSTDKDKIVPKFLDPVKLIQREKQQKDITIEVKPESNKADEEETVENIAIHNKNPVNKSCKSVAHEPLQPLMTQELLERRLKIEDEVTFIGSQKAIAFMQPEGNEEELSDLPDDFYELTIEEVRKIYHDLQKRRIELENTPMLTSTKRGEFEQQETASKLNTYKNVVVRIQFPDNIILQGVFNPNNTLEDVQNFIKEHLQVQDKPFHIFTTPLKETLNPKTTLLEAKFVPCVHMHFKWLEDNSGPPYLKEEIYSKKTTNDAAYILASKYRAPSRRKLEDSPSKSHKSNNETTGTKHSKVPKWFKK